MSENNQSSQKLVTKKDFLKINPLKEEFVSLEEFGYNGGWMVREMTGKTRDQYDSWVMANQEEKNWKEMRARVVIATVVDEKGQLMFEDIDIPDLLKHSGALLTKVASVGIRLSGLDSRSVEDRAKNSSNVPGEDSSSSSASN